MQYGQVVDLLNESGLSPEGIAARISVSNSTYRRWLKAPAEDAFPEAYLINVSSGVYKLLGEKLLNYDSKRVSRYLQKNPPEFFQAAISGFDIPTGFFEGESPHQDKVTAMLTHMGNNESIRSKVHDSSSVIQKFTGWGEAWKERITLLTAVVKHAQFSLVDRLVAYGALFYLILPFDLIPDSIPVVGYIDDFGILGFATAYYMKKFPEFSAGNVQQA